VAAQPTIVYKISKEIL
jgi:hypothetical protein